MYPTIKQFFESIGKKWITIEAGEELMEQKVFRGGQSAEGIHAWKNIEYGEILFISGIGLEQISQNLLAIAEELEKKEASLVVRLGDQIPAVPEKLRQYCQETGVVLFSMDISVKLQPVMRKMYELLFQEENRIRSAENMMKNLMTGIYTSEDAQNAYRLGLESGMRFVAAIIVVDDFFKVKEKCGKDGFQRILQKIFGRLEYLLRVQHKEIRFSLMETNDIIILLRNEGEYLEKGFIQKIFYLLMEDLKEKQEKYTISVGIGTLFSNLPEVRRSVTEARRSLQIMQVCNRKQSVRFYDDMGIYRLLFELQDQETFQNIMNGIIGKLREYDLENGENLVETLRVYLENDKNIGVSAQEMFLHRNTFKYRLNKIEEILLCNLSDPNICFNLNLAFKIERFLQSEKMYLE